MSGFIPMSGHSSDPVQQCTVWQWTQLRIEKTYQHFHNLSPGGLVEFDVWHFLARAHTTPVSLDLRPPRYSTSELLNLGLNEQTSVSGRAALECCLSVRDDRPIF